MYQIRITDSDGSNPIVLEKADNLSYNKTLNSANESLSFDYPTGDSKSQYIDNTKLWELWDTISNERLNRGPIYQVDDADSGVLKISGPGRSGLVSEHIQAELVAFYNAPSTLFRNMTMENVAAGPAVKTFVWDGKSGTKSKFFPADIIGTINEEQYNQYHGLSKQTKDNAIDDNDGYLLPGVEKPSNTYSTTDSYWAGTDKKDSLIIDLGDTFNIHKVYLGFPWWGGNQRINDRGYPFRLYYSTHLGDFDDLNPASWVLAISDSGGKVITQARAGWSIYFEAGSNYGKNLYTGFELPEVRYFRVVITDVKAWYGTIFDSVGPVNLWDWQCNPDTTNTRDGAPGAMVGKKINDRTIEPPNDCYASIVEFGAYTKIVEVDEITDVIKQRIRSDNKQIKYAHTCDPSETYTGDNYRKFEPGNFFRHVHVNFSGANSSYTKFFDKDCTNCYSPFNFAILDDYNTMIYRSSSSSGDTGVDVPRYARALIMKGASNATITSMDAWPGKIDPLSWGGQYSYNTTATDSAAVVFRGRSFIWWATIPQGETGATVSIQYRTRNDNTGNWSGFTTLEAAFQLPSDVTSEVVYEVPYDEVFTGGSYEIYIVNLDGGYMSVDSFGGWWAGSLVEYNDDAENFFLAIPDEWKQIYDNRFSSGSMYKTNKEGNRYNFGFSGDRVQLYSAKGRNHGKITISMSHHDSSPPEFDPVDQSRVFIPGGDTGDGTLTIDLGTGKKGHEVPGALIFDTGLLTGWKFGAGGSSMDSLPWGQYGVQFALSFPETYLADPTIEDSDQFVSRCSDCNPETDGTEEINKYIFVDTIARHETAGMSGSWKLQTHTDIIASIAEALELEWDIGEHGLLVLPRLGADTDVILLEGNNTVISSEIIKDGQKMATQLYSSGADIDGLPLFTIVEDRKNRRALGRTIQKIQDYRDLADYFTLVGVSRAELIRRREPEHRISVTHIGYKYGLVVGDSVLVKKRVQDAIRTRINTLTILQSKSNGITYQIEGEKWPTIV